MLLLAFSWILFLYSIEFCPICTYFWISLDVSLFFSLLHPICACFWILFGCFSDFLADYIQSALTSGFFLDVFLTFLLSASNPLLFLVFLWMFLLHSYWLYPIFRSQEIIILFNNELAQFQSLRLHPTPGWPSAMFLLPSIPGPQQIFFSAFRQRICKKRL